MLVPFDDLSLYEIEEGGDSLKPVFAVGDWVEEIMAEEISVANGVTGWVVRNRRTRNVPNTLLEPLCTVVSGTDEVAEAFVAVPLIAHGRVVGSLNVYRTGADVPFSGTEVELVERFATMAALAYDSARQRDLLREEVRTTASPACSTTAAARSACAPRSTTPTGGRSESSSSSTSTTSSASTTPSATPRATARSRSPPRRCATSCASPTPSAGSAARSSCSCCPASTPPPPARPPSAPAIAISEVQIGGRQLACSAGLACHPDDAGDAPGLLMAADAALYAAKDTGRGRTCRYRPSLALRPSPGEEREEVEAILRGGDATPQRRLPAGARARDRPRVGLRGARPLPRRAAARARRVVRPGAPRRARRRARGRRAARRARRPRPPRRHLPLAQRQPARARPPLVRAELPDDLSTIVIELTEHELFGAEDELAARLAELRARGARIALDDAGAGYAGLQQLIAVAPDILKLDRSLVHGANADPAKLALLEAMISFASSTGAAVCGEGVEDLDDLRALADLDATYAQGYALARPAPPWPLLTPGAAYTAADRLEMGVRVAGRRAARAPGRKPRRARHPPRRHRRGPRARHRRPQGRRPAGRRRRVADDRLQGARAAIVELLSAHPDNQPGEQWSLDDFPATAHLVATGQTGQVVAGDPLGDPAELAELERLRIGAMLMVPVELGRGRRALMEVYRVRPQAFSRAQIERARVVALQLGAVIARLTTR